MSSEYRDYMERRIVVDYGRRYVYLSLQDAKGNVIASREEVFTQPFLLDRKDAHQEADDCWQEVYQWLSDVIVWPLPDPDGDSAESG